MLSVTDYRAAFESAASEFATTLVTSDPASAVPSCPGWTILDLARHLGSVHRWAAECIRSAAPADEPEGPETIDEVVPWFVQGAAALTELLAERDPAESTWTFGPPPRTVSFWQRRQAHETVMHLWDLRSAIGAPEPIDARLAGDGMDEVASMFFPRQVRLQRIPPLARGIRLVAADVRSAAVVIAGDGTDPGAEVVATAKAPASDLLLGLWGREDWRRWEIHGDAGAVGEVLTAGIVP